MPFSREQKQILSLVKRSGDCQKGFIKTYQSDPMGGGSIEDLSVETYFTQSSLNGKDYADPSLANGLFKLLIPPITDSMSPLMDFTRILNNKTTKFIFPDGKVVGVISVKLTMPDGVTPILARLYVGG